MGLRIFGWIFSGVFAFCIGLIGSELTKLYLRIPQLKNLGLDTPGYRIGVTLGFAVLGAIIGFYLGSSLYRRVVEAGARLKRIPVEDKVAAVFGTVLSLLLAYLLGNILYKVLTSELIGMSPVVVSAIILMLSVLLVWLGNAIALSMKDELKFLVPSANRNVPAAATTTGGIPKLLDTNVIIDGRIYDICRAGFLDGPIILPAFVLEELHHIADSADALRRNRGRRGLDILHQMQTELDTSLRMMDRYKVTFAPGDQVDIKLVKLAKGMGADIVTNDFNLNKVAKIHGVRVLNVNELANAVKPVVLPGEELHVNIVREGKEYNQGVGYLDDGTMVVVENGKKMLGDTVPVSVSSVLQTVAGKMIFAELKYENGQEDTDEHSGYYSGRGNRRKTL